MFLLHTLCALSLALGLVIFQRLPLNKLSGELGTLALLLGGGYLLCAVLLWWREHRTEYVGFEALVTSWTLGFAPAALYALHMRTSLPNRVVLGELLWGGALATATVVLRLAPRTRMVVLALAAVLGFTGVLVTTTHPPMPPPMVRTWRLNSELYALTVTEYRGLVAKAPATGGAVSAFRDRFVVSNAVGDVYVLHRDVDGKLSPKQLKQQVPINWHDFQHVFGDQEDVSYFRMADLLVQDLGDKARVFATHHYWKADQECFVVRVSMLELPSARLLEADDSDGQWKTVFETSPCIKLDTHGPLVHFGGIQIGGRLALLNPNELMVAIGDHEHDGVNSQGLYSQEEGVSYGKTLLINLTDFSSQIFSKGHRNPQGLFIDGSSGIWETEHGPQGGDELNLVKRGANYGWPSVTYGTQYGAHFWPGDPTPGNHDGFAEPFYSWVPSIGVSSVMVVRGPEFKLWQGDVIVSSLRDGSLYRARVRDQRIVMMERVPFGRRIRDITEGSEGQLLLWTDKGAILEVRVDDDVGGGESVFQVCGGCHQVGDGTTHGIGPDLRKVVGRQVASMSGYRYSAAMKKAGGKWTRERLDQFITNPQAVVPGTKMRYPGMTNSADRQKLIEFLASGANNYAPAEIEDAPE